MFRSLHLFAVMVDATVAVPLLQVEDFALPTSTVRLRACLGCRLILPFTQFVRTGCPNCPNADFQGDRSAVDSGTTKHFTGCVGVADPSGSWVARHLRVELYVPGMYAILAGGPDEDEAEGEARADSDYEDEQDEDEQEHQDEQIDYD